MRTLPLRIDRAARASLGTQLTVQIRGLITGGALPPDTRLPSTRALALDLGVARAVAEQAYGQLVAEGWLEGRHGTGTFVTAAGPGARPAPARSTPARTPPRTVLLDTGTPWIDPRHEAAWRRAWREVSVATPPRDYLDSRGLPELRTQIADRLARTRGLEVHPDEVVVTTGTTDGLRHLLRALPAGPVAIEDPGYQAAVATVHGAGRRTVDLPALEPVSDLGGAIAAYVTPAHQHPLGQTMTGTDRLALLAAARSAGAVVIEDDYDSEFRYDVAPLPALAALDRSIVAYLGTASKSVTPGLRLGWLVPPPCLVETVNELREQTNDAASWPSQRAFLALLREGYVDKVIRSARRVYAERSERVVAALSPYGELVGPVAGMYACFQMPAERAERGQRSARRAGFTVPRLEDYCRSADLHGLVVGFGGCTDVELDAALTALRRGLDRP